MPKTNVFTVAELLAGFGSKLGELTTTASVVTAGTGGFGTRTVKLTVADAPLGMFPRLQVTVRPCAGGGAVQETPPEFIDRKYRFRGYWIDRSNRRRLEWTQVRYSHCVDQSPKILPL